MRIKAKVKEALRNGEEYVGVCPRCHEKKALILAPDPYSSEINDDHTHVIMCQECRFERAEDV